LIQAAFVGTDRAEQLRVESCGGYVLNGRVSGMLAVTRALGDHMLKGEDLSLKTTAELCHPVPASPQNVLCRLLRLSH
jgi:hypothetical protein